MAWYEESFVYQIYPLGLTGAPYENDGIQEHRILQLIDNGWIEHLQKLGVTCVMLNPVFESEAHGYDTVNYALVDVRLGTNEDLRTVVDVFHAAGMRVDGLGEKHPVGTVTVGGQAELMVPEGVVDVVHRSGFNNDEPYATFGAFFIIGNGTRARVPVIFAIEHLHGRHYGAVFNPEGSDFPRGKQYWIHHVISFQGSAAARQTSPTADAVPPPLEGRANNDQ